MSFNCPIEMREQLDELARQAGWSRGKFIFHLMDKILPDVSVEVLELQSVPLRP